jgi:hypothetical protein
MLERSLLPFQVDAEPRHERAALLASEACALLAVRARDGKRVVPVTITLGENVALLVVVELERALSMDSQSDLLFLFTKCPCP